MLGNIYFTFRGIERLADFLLDAYDWESNVCAIEIRKEKALWIVCLKEVDE